MIQEKQKLRESKGNSLIDNPRSFVVFDIETTGLDTSYDDILEIGALKIADGKIIDTFETLIKPDCFINEFITDLTGITNKMVEDAPKIDKVLPKFIDFIGNNILIGHNVNFDINFIYDKAIELNLDPISNDFIDTLRLSRKLLPNLDHHRLSDLADYYNINKDGSHRALKDVEITLELYNHLNNEINKQYESITELQKICKRHSSFKASEITTANTEFDEDNLLFDKYVAITGTLEKMQRKEAMQIIADLGGHCEDNVTLKTNYLVLGNNDYNSILKGKKSSKLIKAENLKLKGNDIEIISENVFYDIIDEYI